MLRPEQLLILVTVNFNESNPVPVEETEPAENTEKISEFNWVS